MIEGTINGEAFKLEWTGGRAKLETKSELIKHIVRTSRWVLLFDPYMNSRRHADINASEYDGWLILNYYNSQMAIDLKLTRADIKYEPEDPENIYRD